MSEWILLIGGTTFIGAVCAVASLLIRDGRIPWWTYGIVGLLSSLFWPALLLRKKLSLVTATIGYDIVYAFSYFLVLVLLGEAVSGRQWLGLAIGLVAIILVSSE